MMNTMITYQDVPMWTLISRTNFLLHPKLNGPMSYLCLEGMWCIRISLNSSINHI